MKYELQIHVLNADIFIISNNTNTLSGSCALQSPFSLASYQLSLSLARKIHLKKVCWFWLFCVFFLFLILFNFRWSNMKYSFLQKKKPNNLRHNQKSESSRLISSDRHSCSDFTNTAWFLIVMVLSTERRNFSPLDWLGILLGIEKKRKIYFMTIPSPTHTTISVSKSKSLCKSQVWL